MPKSAFQEASRAQVSLLAPLEKRCLIWMARRTPRWINSDHLTALGLVALAGAGLSYWYARYARAGLVLLLRHRSCPPERAASRSISTSLT